MMLKPMNLKAIRVDGDTQSRAELDENVVDEYANAMNDGAVFPPPILYFDGTEYWAADGFHRIAAAKLAGKASLTCEIRKGSLFDAKVESAGANEAHGLRRSNADKRNSVLMMMRDPQTADWSDNRFAETCKVTRQFVSDVKRPEARAERDKRAAAKKTEKKTGTEATKPDGKPGTEVGVVTVSKGKHQATVAPGTNPESTVPTAQELHDEDPVRVLSEENDRLKDRLAVELMEGTEEEKTDAAETIATLRRELAAVTAERDAMSSQFNLYVRENNELKGEIVRMRKKLDQATGKAPAPKGKK